MRSIRFDTGASTLLAATLALAMAGPAVASADEV